MIFLDFETRSEIPITAGAYNYSIHPSTDVLLLQYRLHEEDTTKLIDYSQSSKKELPKDLLKEIKKGTLIQAWNATFEIYIFWHVGAKKYGWPKIPLEQFIDSMAVASRYGLPLSLEGAGRALGLSQDKLKIADGKKLINFFCKPDVKTGRFREMKDYPNRAARFKEYAVRDVDTMVEILTSLPTPTLQVQEQEHWITDFWINYRGVKIDLPTVKAAININNSSTGKYESRISELTQGKVTTGNQTGRILAWAKTKGANLPNLQKETVARALEDPKIPEAVKEVLRCRQVLSKSSVTKYETMLDLVSDDGRIRGMFQFNGASRTSRWAGRGVQPHSLPKGEVEVPDEKIPLITKEQVDKIEKELGPFSVVLSSAIRQMFIAEKGKRFRVYDWSGIENRVTAWLAEDEIMLGYFRNSVDQYKIMAGKVFRKSPKEVNDKERFIGKQIILGCGYGMGGNTFANRMEQLGVKISVAEATKYVKVYRAANKKIALLWKGLEKAAIKAMRTGSGTYKKITFFCKGGNLYCRLPNRKLLTYREARLKTGDWGNPVIAYKDVSYGRLVERETYGGKLTENIAQAISREILAETLTKARKEGFSIVLHVHDEIVSEEAYGDKVHTPERLEQLMTTGFDWAEGLPLAVEGFESERYRK